MNGQTVGGNPIYGHPGGQIHKVICIIAIFGVIFGQNMVIGPPRVTTYRVTTTVWPFILMKYYHALFQMYFVDTLHYQVIQIGMLFA